MRAAIIAAIPNIGAVTIPSAPAIAPILEISVPITTSTGPMAATTRPTMVIIFCASGDSSLNLFRISVIF